MRDLISEVFTSVFLPPGTEDQARLMTDAVQEPGAQLAFTTDSFVVTPLEFPGGDIGRIAVCGAVNDLAVGGAKPLWLSAAFIIEEGCEIALLRRIVATMAAEADKAGVRIVPRGDASAFLAPLPVAVLDDDTVSLFGRLGVQTLGAVAALGPERLSERFGARGARLYALASGRDPRPVQARTPPPELHREIAFEPPVALADQIAFARRSAI